MRKALFCTILLILEIVLSGALPAAAAPRYTANDLGTVTHPAPYQENIYAVAINAAGQVAGRAETASGVRAFLYSNGVMQNLGTLGGAVSYATGINDAGQVVGDSLDSSGNGRAFLYSDGVMQDLGTLPAPYNVYGSASGINAAGQVVGTSFDSVSYGRAFLYSGGKMQDLGTLPDHIASGGSAINSAGQVVGQSVDSSGYSHVFFYSGGGMQDLGTLPAPYNYAGWASAINSAGQVVGYGANSSSNYRPFLYNGAVMLALGPVPAYNGYAYGINTAGQVVGTFDGRAFIYEGGVMQDLTSLVKALPGIIHTLIEAKGINDQGQIIATGTEGSGRRAILLTPIRPLAAPASNMLLLLD